MAASRGVAAVTSSSAATQANTSPSGFTVRDARATASPQGWGVAPPGMTMPAGPAKLGRPSVSQARRLISRREGSRVPSGFWAAVTKVQVSMAAAMAKDSWSYP